MRPHPQRSPTAAPKYGYMPDKSWKATGTCTNTYKGGDKRYEIWEEGSHLKEYTFKTTGETGKYEGASGEGTKRYDCLEYLMMRGLMQDDQSPQGGALLHRPISCIP
jgi:hypothetical protein